MSIFQQRKVYQRIKYSICCCPKSSWIFWDQNTCLVLLIVREHNVLDNNPASFFSTNSNRQKLNVPRCSSTQQTGNLLHKSEVGGHCYAQFCNLKMEGLEWL